MKTPFRITPAEWEIMVLAWHHEPLAASQAARLLNRKKGWTLATVRTLLRRLVAKGALAQEDDGKRYLYRPRVTMRECVHQESESFLDRVLGRVPSATILNLVEKADLTNDDIEELRRILQRKEK